MFIEIKESFDYTVGFYNKATIQRLCKMYYLCLHKLFKYNFAGKSHDAINGDFKKDNLFSFQYRIVYRLSMFTNNVMFNKNSPTVLKQWLIPSTLVHQFHNTRSNNTISFVLDRTYTKFGDLTYKNMFCKWLNSLDYRNFMLSTVDFKVHLLSGVLKLYFNKLISLFSKFDSSLDFYFYRKA